MGPGAAVERLRANCFSGRDGGSVTRDRVFSALKAIAKGELPLAVYVLGLATLVTFALALWAGGIFWHLIVIPLGWLRAVVLDTYYDDAKPDYVSGGPSKG